MTHEPDNVQWEPIDIELFAGRKIQAIKLYRDGTGSGLKDAKDAIEAREKQLRESSPASFQVAAGGGCLGMVLLAIAATLSLIWS